MNKVFLIGNLTKDPELSQTNNGISFCRFTLAVPRRFQNAAGERETDFLNIIVWRNQAENCHKYLRKGSKASVLGAIQTSNYEAQDGTRKYVTDIVADEVEFLSTKSSSDSASAKKESEEVTELQPIDDDSLPF